MLVSGALDESPERVLGTEKNKHKVLVPESRRGTQRRGDGRVEERQESEVLEKIGTTEQG